MPAWAFGLASIAATVVAAVAVWRSRKGLARTLSAVACGAAVACLVTTVAMCGVAMSHGMQGFGMTLPAIGRSIGLSPRDQSHELASTDDAKGRVIVVYRFACPDCEAAYDAIREATDGRDVLWVSSRSDVGHALCERYGVEWVPSVLSVSDGGRVVVRDLYADDLSGLDAAFDNVRE